MSHRFLHTEDHAYSQVSTYNTVHAHSLTVTLHLVNDSMRQYTDNSKASHKTRHARLALACTHSGMVLGTDDGHILQVAWEYLRSSRS